MFNTLISHGVLNMSNGIFLVRITYYITFSKTFYTSTISFILVEIRSFMVLVFINIVLLDFVVNNIK